MGPFSGLKIIDVSPNRVGAQISQLFSDFGADVIQVEPPGGAVIRRHSAYPFWGRGKRSIVADLTNPSDADLVRALAASADVFIETQASGKLDRWGIGFSALHELNPSLIYTSVTGFGRHGPYRDAPGYEGVVLAKLGAFATFERMGTRPGPAFVTTPFAAFAASQIALHGILAALIERERSGRGQWVETNLLQAFTSLDTWAFFEHLITSRWPDAFTPSTTYDQLGRPASPLTFMLLVCLTADGHWLQFASVAPHLFAATMKALGLGWTFGDDYWKGLPRLEDPDKRQELWTAMLTAANSKTLAEWDAIFEADHDVFAEQFRNGPRALEHPQLLHDRFVVDLIDSERGPVRQPGPIVRATNSPADITRSAPILDEHRQSILASVADLVAPSAATIRAKGDEHRLPLEGITIVELAVLFASPHATTMLSDLGARVIKVEAMGGDPIRNILPFPEAGGAKVMQGKESIRVDLTAPEGLAVVKALAAKADVVLQGFRGAAMTRAGLDYRSIKAINPDVIYVNAPGYGVDGPFGDRPAYAPSIGAAVGLPLGNVGMTVPEEPGLTMDQIRDGARRLSAANAMANAQADGIAALGVATGILFGLVARQRGAGGQELFSSMLNSGTHAMSAQAVVYPGAPHEASPDSELRGLGALYRIYDAAEGFVFLAAPTDAEFTVLARALSPYGDLNNERFATAASRRSNVTALIAALAAVFGSKTATEWERELLPQGIGCVAVTTTSIESMMFDDSFARASGYVVDVVHPSFETHPRLAPYLDFSRSATRALPAVLAGDQTDALCQELGMSPEQVADLRSRNIIG